MASNSKGSGAPADSERNSLQQARPRERTRPPEEAPERAPIVNSIGLAPTRGVAGELEDLKTRTPPDKPPPSAQRSTEKKPDTKAESSAERDPMAIPDHIRTRFVQVGRKYYFPDGVRAFTDRGQRLTTASENTEVIKSLVDIARTRGWGEVVVRGTEHFRREAWFAARMAGIEVRGYKPTEFEESKLVRLIGERRGAERRPAALPEPMPAGTDSPDRSPGPPLLKGKLLEHGRAPYKQDPKEPMSYFVKIETSRGARTFWGVDLERAFKESMTQPQVGEVVGLTTYRKEPVQVQITERDAAGREAGQKSLQTHRNRWLVEKEAFFDARTRAAQTLLNADVAPKEGIKSHPELIGTYLQVKAAELAAKKLKNPTDRAAFVDRVRSALAEAIARGEPLPAVKMKDKMPPRRTPRSTEQAQAR